MKRKKVVRGLLFLFEFGRIFIFFFRFYYGMYVHALFVSLYISDVREALCLVVCPLTLYHPWTEKVIHISERCMKGNAEKFGGRA